MEKRLKIIAFYLILNCTPICAQSDALISLGERLFNEQRFANFFWKNSNGDVNFKLHIFPEWTENITTLENETTPSPFIGQTISCATCHMVDQGFEQIGMRGYNDFSKRSKIPRRSDQLDLTLRNTPTLIGIGSKFNSNRFSHYDGEFDNHRQTVLGNFTGRNMGWLENEKSVALNNIVNVIKNDNGENELSMEFGGSYGKVLLGTDSKIPEKFRLASDERLDIKKASNQEIIKKVVDAMESYLNDIDFEKNETGEYVGSPYDLFLIKNNIRTVPQNGESIVQYNKYLIKKLKDLSNPRWIPKIKMSSHKKSFEFGQAEFIGLKKFFNINQTSVNKKAMCIDCHSAPLFSDQSFHDVGTTQNEYDLVHGEGAFNKLKIPSLKNRKNSFFKKRASHSNPSNVDLGLYNYMFRNEKVTQFMKKQLCSEQECSDEKILKLTIARIKTPSLRNLGHSAPYFHNGSALTIKDVLLSYAENSNLKRENKLRNGDTLLNKQGLGVIDINDIESFLNSLNENYE